MVNCGTLLKSALVAIVLVVVVGSGPTDEKLAKCCETVSKHKITEPITGYMIQKRNAQCVRAVIFQTATGLYCSHLTAPWVRAKIIAFEKAKTRVASSSVVPTSPVSLLSIITSTASPPSSSTPAPSFSATSEMPDGETFSGSDE
uniref:CC chemokine n=1 Tax=Miichthys miiuy TaxID=240162 RepID=E5LR40_MIIMI|nr:CC chemokine [Miichthys miiuy]